MKTLIFLIQKISKIFDKMAAICFFSVMLLIVSNIILRVGFNRPILGTYELVSFLTAVGVGLALAHCALQDGHIAVSFFMERMPKKSQVLTDILMNVVALVFWVMVTWYIGVFGRSMMQKGLVSSSAEIPVYPFIFLISLGILGLCLVLLMRLVISLRELTAGVTDNTVLWGYIIPDPEKRT